MYPCPAISALGFFEVSVPSGKLFCCATLLSELRLQNKSISLETVTTLYTESSLLRELGNLKAIFAFPAGLTLLLQQMRKQVK